MSEFFEPPPPQKPEPLQRMPPWVHAPSGTLPGVVALELVLARTEQVAVCVTRVAAYPAGFEIELVTMANGERDDLDPYLFAGPMGRRRFGGAPAASGGIPPEKLRFGLEFADGTKATNISDRWQGSAQESPSGPLLTPGGGGGGGTTWTQTLWAWPLPPAGRLAFVCEWPAAAIALTRYEIDAQLVLDAASRAQLIFSEDALSASPTARSSSIVFARKNESP